MSVLGAILLVLADLGIMAFGSNNAGRPVTTCART